MTIENLLIRAEKPGDESLIDIVNCKAFNEMNEANLVRLLMKHYSGFDPKYSVTAWIEGEMVGHTLFNPVKIFYMGRICSALVVAPVAVIPEKQRQGVGGAMLNYGHELGKEEGFELAFLNGHSSYYPAHGYRKCFGFSKIIIDTEKLPKPTQELYAMPVTQHDTPWLLDRFNVEFENVDFTWIRGHSIEEWTIPGTDAVLWRTKDNKIAAYTLRKPDNDTLNMVLSDDPGLALDVIVKIKPKAIEHHPSGWLNKNVIDPVWGEATSRLSEAAMACELKEGVVQPCIDAVESGERLPGFCHWPIWFLLV